MSEGKHTPGKIEVDSAKQFLFGRCRGGCHFKEDSFMLAEIRGWGHLQYRKDGVAMQRANIDRLALCWNSHDQLVEALKMTLTEIQADAVDIQTKKRLCLALKAAGEEG